MLKNLWYVARPAAEVGPRPVSRNICGLSCFLYRGKSTVVQSRRRYAAANVAAASPVAPPEDGFA
jgi:hypothetical protein